MKKILLAFLATAFLSSCTLETDDETVLYELVSVESVEIPETLVHGETYTFTISYNRPSTCHAFFGFDYTQNENEQRIGVVNMYFPERNDCEDQGFINETELEFYVERNDFYIFKFWQGENENGEPIFLTIEVPVEE